MEKIDFVLTWVDGADKEWQKEREKYNPEKGADAGVSRYRDWENLQYWFRGIEKYAPWVNRIYFVTWGHVPSWLNVNHPKLKIVRHEEFLKEEYLPTFNINSIELNLHRIEGLSEQFVFFNDDMFLLKSVSKEDFFKDGLPCDCCIETALVQDDVHNPFAHILMNDSALVNMHYSKKDVIRRNISKWFHPIYGMMMLRNILMLPYREFSSFKYTHLPSAFLKSTFEQIWNEEGELLDELCHHRFRTPFDINQYVMKYWQYMEGRYVPQSPKIGKFYTIGKDDRKICETIKNQKCKMVCLNDDASIENFEEKKKNIISSFRKILPEKSQYEI